MKNALVTGANGFIGDYLCKALINSGFQVSKHVRHVNSSDSSEQYECDLETNSFPERALENIDVVYHLAGLAHEVQNSTLNIQQYQSVNVDATIKIANMAAKKNVKQFIFVSSVKAGGNSIKDQCMDEENQNKPIGIYAQTKRAAEIKLIEMSKTINMKVTIIRPALVYGPKVKGNLELMLRGIKYGWFPPIPNNSNLRSMIHIDDIVHALMFITNNKDATNFIYIATDGIPHSTRDLYISMCNALGVKVPRWTVPVIFFKVAALINPRIKEKINKILGDDCYSSQKLESIGFNAKRSIKDINEANF
jgi:UDP-glucose 4-epimerase